MASSLTTSTVISPVTERVFVAPVRRSMTANALRPADGVASRARTNPFRDRPVGATRYALPRSYRPVSLKDLRSPPVAGSITRTVVVSPGSTAEYADQSG